MTKKHFEAFACEIRAQLEIDKLCSPRAAAMAEMVIKVASEDNPRFDAARFRHACGLASLSVIGK